MTFYPDDNAFEKTLWEILKFYFSNHAHADLWSSVFMS
jgi:hypothetical protein